MSAPPGGAAEWDVVVVGAGSAGCPLAARLADAGRRVLVLEAGADHPRPEDFPPVLRDAAAMGAAVPGAAQNWDLTGVLTAEVTSPVPRGRVVGGSSALNGASFIRAPRSDLDGWAADGNDLWSADRLLPAFRRLEADADFAGPLHGTDGPLPVRRVVAADGAGDPLSEAFTAACLARGFPLEPDKNGDGAPGIGPVPFNVADGVRVNTGMAYLSPRRGLPGLTVRGGVTVRRVLLEGGRAVGVDTDAGPVRAAEVVLAAGAVGSPHLLLLSGIGPAAVLRAAGLPVVVDLPGVGQDASDHPDLYVTWTPGRRIALPRGALPLSVVLHTAAEGSAHADLEVLPWLRPFSQVMLDRSAGARLPGTAPRREDLALGVALQQEDSRGRLVLDADHPDRPPRTEYRYLTEERDRRRMREVVRLAAELLATPPMAGLVAARTGLPDEVLRDDAALDRWIRRHLATAVHLSGTARMGPDGDAGAVVDQRLRVRGIDGLRVVDTSVLPRVTSRGPAATAVAVGERAAELVLGGT